MLRWLWVVCGSLVPAMVASPGAAQVSNSAAVQPAHVDHETPASTVAEAMGNHMVMTPLLPEQLGDRERLARVLEDAKAFWMKYLDYRKAEEDGFQPLEPEEKQAMYHFIHVSGKPSFWAPIYAKTEPDNPNSGYRIVAVMRAGHNSAATMEQLNREIPVSMVQWHSHVNSCQPPATYKGEWLTNNDVFGYHGSISTEAECMAAGGTFSKYSGWMLHVHPFDPEPWLSALGDMDEDGNNAKPGAKMDTGMKMDSIKKMDPAMKMDTKTTPPPE